MKSSFARYWPAQVALATLSAGPVLGAIPAPQRAARVAGTIDLLFILVVAMGAGLVAWWLHWRSQKRWEEHTAQRIWEMTALIEHADCLMWEAEVTVRPNDWDWDMTLHDSAFYRRLFRDKKREPGVDLWIQFKVDNREEQNQRARDAMEQGQTGYVQEFRAVREGEELWLHENVSITPLGPNRFWLVGLVMDITPQREAEAARRQSELTVDRILAHAQCLLWRATVIREDGVLKWPHFDIPHSQFSELLFGDRMFSPDRGFWDTLNIPDQVEMDERSTRAILGNAPGYVQQFRAINQSGRIFWLNERVSITRVSDTIWSLVGVVTDITAQHAAETARQTSEARLQELLTRADCLLWESTVGLSDWSWRTTMQESSLSLRLFGKLKADKEIVLWSDFNVPEKSEMDARCRFALEEGRDRYEQVFHIIRDDGSVIWISENVTIRRISENKYSLVGVAFDITPMRRAEEALAAEKERLAVTLRAMNECVITTDVTGLIQYMNPAAAELTGWRAEEVQSRPVEEICRLQNARSDQVVEVPIARVARGDTVADLPAHTRLLTRNGGRRQIEGCCAPIHAADSKVVGTVLVFRDVTEQERLEQELVRATRLESVGVLAGGIAHDFNNILTAVMGNLALAQLDIAADSPAGASLRSAEKAALRARDLTQQLLTFAKGGEPVRAAVQLEAIVREMAAFALHGSQVKAFYDMAPNLWPADADKGQIGRVVQNLVINAVQAMPRGGTLRIMARNDPHDGQSHPSLGQGDYIQIAIADTGEGIKQENLARIFDPYFTTKQTGTGLGLAAVYSIVKKHHGHIDVESQVGQGTTFRIWLPALRQHLAQFDTRTPWNTPDRMEGRVLFMDDEQIIRDMAVMLLQRFGLTVDCAVDGAEAIEKYRTALAAGSRYDLVIMDLTVPGGMGGLDALGHLRLLDPSVRAVVSSGYSSDPVLANYRAHGFAAVIAKPYEVNELSRVLREVLAG